MRPRLPYVAVLACIAGASTAAGQADPKPLHADRAEGAKAIRKDQLKDWLTTLTSPEFGGRGTGQAGFGLAAEFLRKHFQDLGLKPGTKDGKFFQPVPWSMTVPDREQWKFELLKDDKTVHSIELSQVHGNLGQTVSAKGKAMLAVISDLDDIAFDEVDLDGAVVFAVVTDTAAGPRTRLRGIRNVVNRARRAGAGAVFLADDATFASTQALTGAVTAGRGRAARGRFLRPNQFSIAPAELTRVLKALGADPKKALSAKGVVDLGGTARIEIRTTTAQAPAYNVCAVLPGTDPRLKDEYVVVGCHLDHLGIRNGVIHPGADDDGSGSVGLMAIAQAFAKNRVKPRRSVMFLAFCGEEMGLIGSQFFAKNPPIELSQIVAELQIDMIGRDETGQRGEEKAEDNKNSLHLIGTQKLSKDLHDLCLRLNEERGKFDLEWDEEGVFYRSDHFSFAKHGVPIAFFFTGFHKDYHRPTDTVEKINFDKLSRIATYVYDLAFELAQQDQRPLVDQERWDAMPRKGRKEPVAPVRGK